MWTSVTTPARRHPLRERVRTCLATLLLTCLLGCRSELGECDTLAANELVYGRDGLVATKGQALVHDSCGNGAFCHAALATSKRRYGAPARMDFDMLPSPTGLSEVRGLAEDVWKLVRTGQMPPVGSGSSVIGDGAWLADVARDHEAPRLPALATDEGKAILRNWLACGAPVVVDTRVPRGVQPGSSTFDAGDGTPTWSAIFQGILLPTCATQGCHSGASAAGGLALEDACDAYAALFQPGACDEAPVLAGSADSSLLIDKLESDQPRCGTPMPPTGPLPEGMKAAVRAWIEGGAQAETCQ
jgi:hypothetical protein